MRHGWTPSRITLGLVLVLVQLSGSRAWAVETWTLPDAARGHRVAPILLLSRPDVRADLRLKPDQAADAERVIAAIHARAAQLRGRDDAATIELRRAVDDEQRNWLETHLTEDQVGRLSEIDLQWEGIAAIASRPGVREALALSDEQKHTLGQLVAERQAQRSRPPERQRDPATAERQFANHAAALLDDGQRRRWELMLGHPFTASTLDHAASTTSAPR